MSIGAEVSATVGRKKRSIPVRTLKAEEDLVIKARVLAQDQGLDIATYVSRILRPVITREWAKMIQRTAKEGGE
jgi:hypothetical protein